MKSFSRINRAAVSALFILLLSIQLHSQQCFRYKSWIKTGLPSYEPGQYMINYKIYGNKCYSLFTDNYDSYVNKDMVARLDVTNLLTSDSKSYKISFNTKNKLMELIKKNFVMIGDYLLQDDDLYVLACKYVIKLKLNADEYKVDKIITIKENITSSYISNFTNSYAIITEHYPHDNSPSVFAAKLNLKNGSIKQIIYPKVKGLMFAIRTSNWWSFSEKYILLAGNLEYKVNIYDKQSFKLIDSIQYEKKGFSKNSLAIDTITHISKNTIVDLRKMDKTYNRIFNAYFLNDSTILLVLSTPDQAYTYTDVWQKQSGKWNLLLEDGKNINDTPPDTLICKNNNFLRIGLGISTRSVFWNNYLIRANYLYLNPIFFEGKPFSYFIDCLKNKIGLNEIKENIDYQHTGVVLYEVYKP